MSTSVQIRQKISELAKRRAELEKKLGDAHRVKASKESTIAAKEAAAGRTSSLSMQRLYLREADSARRVAPGEGKKIAELTRKLADVAKLEGSRSKELGTALKTEAAIEARASAKARTERETAEKKRREEDRREKIRREQERLASEQRRREDNLRREQERMADQAAAAAMVAASERRLVSEIDSIRPPRREQLRILYATASSGGELRVDEEIRRVKAAVLASTHRDQVLVEHLPAATPSDLLDGLTSFHPHVVHFSGHANESVLVFDSGAVAAGPGRQVAADAFKNAINAPDEPPTLVVLNACKSAAQLNSLLGKVAIAIGMENSVGDADAITFATRFYRSLAEGQSVSAALATARADMQMNGLADHDLPTMAILPGLDPTQIQLVIPI